MEQNEWKEDGFENERKIIIPTESFAPYADHPMVQALYATDIGYYPRAARHHVERPKGSDQNILLYCLEGKGTVEIDGESFVLGASDALCIPRSAQHRYYADAQAPWSILWVHFKGENVSFFPITPCRVIHMNSTAADQRMMTLFRLVFRVLERNYSQGNFIYLSQVLSVILSEVYFREKTNESPAGRRIVTKAVHYMTEHLSGQLRLEQLCDMFRISGSYLNVIFREETGHAPLDFFLHLKMQEACRLLEDPSMRVGEAARQLGYEDPYYFSRVFSRVIGMSPRAYRESHSAQR